MKKIISAVFAVSMLITVGCKSGPSSSDPKATLISFFKALANKDLKTAREYATKESESMFSMMEMAMKMGENMKTPENEDQFKKFQDTEIGEPIITGDKAIVPVKSKSTGEATNFILKKESGAWKVAFDKESMKEMSMDKMKENGMDHQINTQNVNLDSLAQVLKSINSDSLQKVMKEGMGKLDSLQEVLKALKK